jgi:hypothetical protein
MPHSIGQTLPLSRFWRTLCDRLSFGHPGPVVRIQRRLLLADVVAARSIASPCPSWRAVFVKAIAHVSAANPLLRRSFLSWPWPRIYGHPVTVAVVPVRSDDEIKFVRVRQPEALRLAEIDEILASSTRCRKKGSGFGTRVGVACSGRVRARKFGTLSVATASLCPPTPLTPELYHGSISANGEVEVSLSFDERVMDGIDAGRLLSALEDSLHERVLTELRYLESLEAA